MTPEEKKLWKATRDAALRAGCPSDEAGRLADTACNRKAGVEVEGDLVVSPVPAKGGFLARLLAVKTWRIMAEVRVKVLGVAVAVIPAGWETDFASVPKWLKPCFPDAVVFGVAAVVHDWNYKSGVVSRWLADALFYEILKADLPTAKARPLQRLAAWAIRAAMWLGVRLGGWVAWRKHRKTEKAKSCPKT